MASHLWLATDALYSASGAELKTPYYGDIFAKNQPKETAEQVKARVVALFSK